MRHGQHVIHSDYIARIDLGKELGLLCAQLNLSPKEMVREAKAEGFSRGQICFWNVAYKRVFAESA
jgi:hypothetical protein